MSLSARERAALSRAVLISLFSWRRAPQGSALDDDNRNGWWGDSFPDVADDRIGSLLWLLQRERLDDATLRAAERHARQALQWLIDDNQAASIDVQAMRRGDERLDLRTTLTLPGGERLDIPIDDHWQVNHGL